VRPRGRRHPARGRDNRVHAIRQAAAHLPAAGGCTDPASAGEIGINLEPQEFRCTNAAEFGKTTLNQVGVQKIRLVARTKQGTGDIVAEKVVEVPLTIVPTPFSIARYADTVNLMVNGRGVVRSVSNDDTREEEGSQSVNVSIPSSDYRTPRPRRLGWLGRATGSAAPTARKSRSRTRTTPAAVR